MEVKQGGWTEALGEHAANPTTPRQTGEVIVALGKEWLVAPNENRIKAQFEQYCRRNATIATEEIVRDLDPDTAAGYRKALIADRASGVYNWPHDMSHTTAGRGIRDALKQVEGHIYLLWLCLRRCDNGKEPITLELARKIFMAEVEQCFQATGFILKNLDPLGSVQATGGEKQATLDDAV